MFRKRHIVTIKQVVGKHVAGCSSLNCNNSLAIDHVHLEDNDF